MFFLFVFFFDGMIFEHVQNEFIEGMGKVHLPSTLFAAQDRVWDICQCVDLLWDRGAF
jgi:hypothetical protein